MLVTDNGTTFTSTEFQEFIKANGIRHVKSSPYHPASNGLAERAVQTFKASMRKSTNGSIKTCFARFLFRYRYTPHTTTGLTPSELIFGRHVRTHLDLVKPDLTSRVQLKQQQLKLEHGMRTKERNFEVEDKVFVQNFPPKRGTPWYPGQITAVRGPLSYIIELQDGRCVRRHVDHIRIWQSSSVPVSGSEDLIEIQMSGSPVQTPGTAPTHPPSAGQPLCRSYRVRCPPDRLTY